MFDPKSFAISKPIVAALAGLSLAAMPIVVLADASAPIYKAKPKAKAKPRKRVAPRARAVQAEPVEMKTTPAEIVQLVEPTPVYQSPAVVQQTPVAAAPEAVAPAPVATGGKGGNTILALLAAAAVIAGIVVAAGGSNGPSSP